MSERKTVWKCDAPWRCSNCGATRPFTEEPPFWEHRVRYGKRDVDCGGVWVSLEERQAIMAAYRLGGRVAATDTMEAILKPKTAEGRMELTNWLSYIQKPDLWMLCNAPPVTTVDGLVVNEL